MNDETLLQFPCEFPVKAIGHGHENFDALVLTIVRRHAPDIHETAVKTRPSKGGKYTAVTVTIQASSKAQLDALYQDLSDHPDVLMAL